MDHHHIIYDSIKYGNWRWNIDSGESDSVPPEYARGRDIWLVSGRSDVGKKYGMWLEYTRQVSGKSNGSSTQKWRENMESGTHS